MSRSAMYTEMMNRGEAVTPNVIRGGRPSGMTMEEAGLIRETITSDSAWGGLTTQNHLGSVFSANPVEVSKLMTMGGRAAGKSNALQQLLAGYSSKAVGETEYEWELQSNKFNRNGDKVGGLIWLTDEEEGFDSETGEMYVDHALKHKTMNLKVSRDER